MRTRRRNKKKVNYSYISFSTKPNSLFFQALNHTVYAIFIDQVPMFSLSSTPEEGSPRHVLSCVSPIATQAGLRNKQQTAVSRQQPAASSWQTESKGLSRACSSPLSLPLSPPGLLTVKSAQKVQIDHQQTARPAKPEKREAKRRPSNPELYNCTPSPRKGGIYSFHSEVNAVCCL
jgi:hypothetical protein